MTTELVIAPVRPNDDRAPGDCTHLVKAAYDETCRKYREHTSVLGITPWDDLSLGQRLVLVDMYFAGRIDDIKGVPLE